MCIFCKIVKKEIPAEIVYEDEEILSFKDASPIAPVHILIIPKKHIESIREVSASDIELLGKIIFKAKELAQNFDISEKGYKLLFRVGEWGGQEVPHIHLHLIGGARMVEKIYPIN